MILKNSHTLAYPSREYVYKKWSIVLETEEDVNYEVAFCQENQITTKEMGVWFLTFADKCARKKNLHLVCYYEDMHAHAIQLLCVYLDSFNPTRGNVFSYFTKICDMAFAQWRYRERKEYAIAVCLYESTLPESGYIHGHPLW